MADLLITDPALTAAQATFRTASDRLAPVVRRLQAWIQAAAAAAERTEVAVQLIARAQRSDFVELVTVSVREAHSALNWPLLTCGLFGPAAGVAICVVLGITVSPQWLPWVMFVLFGLFLVPISLLCRNWPTGHGQPDPPCPVLKQLVGDRSAAGRCSSVGRAPAL